MEISGFGVRLAKLREAKGVSASAMSLEIGKSPNYINKIENRKCFPSMEMFFEICDYLGVSQMDFFDDDIEDPVGIYEFISDYQRMDTNDRTHVAEIVKGLAKKK